MPNRISLHFLSESIMVKYQNIKNKEKILNISKEENHIAFKRTRIILFSEFSSLPLNAVRKERM